jgi:lactoylglutathione lyase
MSEPGIIGLGHIAISARDFAQLHTFYTTALGFRELYRLHTDQGDLLLVALRIAERQFLELFPDGADVPPPPQTAGLNHLSLTVADLERTITVLAEHGVRLTHAFQSRQDGTRWAWITDPEGNRIELIEYGPEV